MIKIKIYRLSSGRKWIGDTSVGVSDYSYCVYFFGILIHSVTLHDINYDSVRTIFGNKPIIKTEEE